MPRRRKQAIDREEGTAQTRIADMLSNASSVALVALCVVGFLGPAIAGVTMIQRLGGAGWVMYALVMGTWALVFGPLLAHAAQLRENGSRRAREEKRARIDAQRRKFGLHHRIVEEQEREAAAEAAAAAAAPTRARGRGRRAAADDRWKPGEGL